MTIFHSDLFLALSSAALVLIWAWMTVSSLRRGQMKVAGQLVTRKDHWPVFWLGVGIQAGISTLMFLLVIQLLVGFDASFSS
jgi:hypothetical protein